jgi:hypothetical protein
MVNKKASILLTVTFLSTFSLARAKEKPIEQMNAREIYLKYRHMKLMELQNWNASSGKVSKGMTKLNNKYFSIIYQKCFAATGIYDNDDPGLSAQVLFDGSKCKDQKQTEFSAGISGGDHLKKVSDAFSGRPLTRTPLKIGGQEWYLLADVVDMNNGVDPIRTQLRWEAFTICGDRTMTVNTTEKPGQPSLDRIKSENYDPPEFFKQIVSTFQCKSENRHGK